MPVLFRFVNCECVDRNAVFLLWILRPKVQSRRTTEFLFARIRAIQIQAKSQRM